MFDFDNTNTKNFEISTKHEGILIKENLYNVKFVPESEITENYNKLLKVEIKDNNFYLKFLHTDLDFEKLGEIPWMVIRNIKSIKDEREYKLTIGDIIKFGRVKLKITNIFHEDRVSKDKFTFENEKNDIFVTKSDKLNIQENITKNYSSLNITHVRIPSKMTMSSTRNHLNNLSSRNNFNSLSEKNTIDDNERTLKKRFCRICLDEYDPIDKSNNILVNPCKCSGSSKYIHFLCLQTWLKSKAVVNCLLTPACNYYEIKDIECEICKIIFPGNIFI